MKCNPSRVEYNSELQKFMIGVYEFDVKSLYAHLEEVRDKRERRGIRYQLADALALIILAKLGGEDEPRGIARWLRDRAELLVKALDLPWASMPHETTISRILGQAVEPTDVEKVIQRYFDGQVQSSKDEVIAIDGKTMRGTRAEGEKQGIHLLSAYLPQEGVVLYQTEVDSKENEVSAIPRLLAEVNVRGKVVIGDALPTQRAASMLVSEERGYYLWIAKENRSVLKSEIAHLFAPQQCPPATSPLPTDFRSVTRYSYGHGRFETRTLTASTMLKDYLDWPYLEQVFKLDLEQHHLTSGKRSTETYYGVTNLPPAKASPDRLLALKRHYWGIENRFHYRRDVSLNEDRCRLRRGHAAQVMAIINNLALIDRLDFSTVPDARCRFSAKPLEALNLIFQNPVTTLQ